MKIIRRKLLRKKIPLSDSSVDRLEPKAEFPARVQLSDGCMGWVEEEVDEWLRSRSRGPWQAFNSKHRERAAWVPSC